MKPVKLAAAAAGAMILGGCAHASAPPEKSIPLVRVQEITSGVGAVGTVRYSANIKPDTTVDLSFKVGGYVEDVLRVRGTDGRMHVVQEGDLVRAGTVLARVRQTDYVARVDQAQAQVANSKAGVSGAFSKRGESRASLEQARSGLAGAVASKSHAESRLAEAQAAEAQAQSGLTEAQAAQEQTKTTLSEARAAVAQAEAGLAEAREGEAQAQSTVQEAEAARKSAQAVLTEAQAGLTQATQDVERAKKLLATQSLTRSEFDGYKARHEAAEARVQAAREQVGLAQARERTAKAQVRAIQAKIEGAKAAVTAGQARVEGVRALLNVGQARIDRAKAQVSAAAAAVKGAEALIQTSDSQISHAKAQVQAVEEVVRGTGSLIQSSRASEQAAEAALRETRLSLTDASLRVPMDAVVLKRNVEVGSLVAPGSVGFVLADVRTVKAVIGVPDTVVQQIRMGETLRMTTDALPDRTFHGRITAISPDADPRSRVFNVEVSVPNPRSQLKVGMIGTITVGRPKLAAATPVVPLASIVRSKSDPEGYAVVVVEEKGGEATGHLRDVTVGEAYGNGVALLDGVQRGDRVVVLGASLVRDGAPVRVIP